MEDASGEILYEKRENHRLEYTCNAQFLTDAQREAYNVIILGPSGCGKSTIINHMFNKSVSPTGAYAYSVTREVRFYHGKIDNQEKKSINIIDTIGKCSHFLQLLDTVEE